jgi:hypothetical protein
MPDAESHADADWDQKESGNDHLRYIEAHLGYRGINISPAQRPPSKQAFISAFRHEVPFLIAKRNDAGTSNLKRFQ